MSDTIIDLTDPAIQAWQRNNIQLSLAGWALITEFTEDGCKFYAELNGERIDNTPPKCGP